MAILQIPRTLDVICTCWESAEKDLHFKIATQLPDAAEEFITREFHGLFKKALDDASSERRIEQAFLLDLRSAFPALQLGRELGRIANGLVAEAVLHDRKTEERTGGDIGLVIDRPEITVDRTTLLNRPHQSGLLCQAKLRDPRGKWGHLTKAQKKELPKALKYLGLLLYEYEDEERHILRPFAWQLGSSATQIDEIVQWLKSNRFPSLVSSRDIVRQLGNGKIGTSNKKLISEIVAPPKNITLQINITWKDGVGPGSRIMILSRQENTVTTVFVRH